MNDSRNNIEDLLSRISVLENENMMLAERSEDMSLMSMISELANDMSDPNKMLREILERISMLKDITFCTCGTIQSNTIVPLASFWQLDKEYADYKVDLDPEITKEFEEGLFYGTGEIISKVHLPGNLSNQVNGIKEILIFPFQYKINKQAVFLFADNREDESGALERMIPLLQQLTYMAEDRINNLYLLEQLGEAKAELENRVQERTADLVESNKELESEIIKRQKIERELELSEEKFREIFNNANDAIVLWELDENEVPVRCLEANDIFLMMTGYTAAELRSLNTSDLRGEEKEEMRLKRIQASKEGKRSRFEIPLLTKSGVEIPTEATTQRFTIQNKQVVLAVHRDISERKAFENRILIEKQRAEESDRLKSAFLANMSHEIRTPMNAIMGFSELLQQDGLSDEERNAYLKIVNSKGQDLLTLINDILYFSKIEANQVIIKQELLNIEEFLRLSMINWQLQLENSAKKELIIESELSGIDGAMVKVDRVRISQVMNNLISNAIKFTDRGRIDVKVKVENGQLEISVKDTGIGIHPGKTEQIFERFRQADEGKDRKYGGTGLGLSISKQLIELMNGEMGVRSEPGKGSEFWFSIPVEIFHRTNKATGHEKYREKNETDLSSYRILIVEDEKTNYDFLRAALSIHNMEIIHAATGEAAIRLIAGDPDINLVLMDIHLPEMNGVTASEKIKAISPEMKIIAQTAISPDEMREMDPQGILDDYIFKPINIELLFSKIARYLAEE